MKTNHTDEQYQAAIDAACKETHKAYPRPCGQLVISKNNFPLNWPKETTARLHLLKSALDYLPEPPPPVVDGKMPAEIPWTEWHGGPCPLKDEEVKEWQYRFRDGFTTNKPDRPSVYVWAHTNSQDDIIAYRVLKWRDEKNPDWKSHSSCYRIKPEPDTFEAHGKTWTRHTPGDPMPCDENRSVEITTQKAIDEKNWYSAPHDGSYWNWGHSTNIIGWRYADEPTPEAIIPQPWTPKVGDVVTLKSGGPRMTVMDETESKHLVCFWFKRGEKHSVCVLPSTLQPA